MDFAEYLEDVEGITWEYFDNNYDGKQAEEIYEAYLKYIKKGDQNDQA